MNVSTFSQISAKTSYVKLFSVLLLSHACAQAQTTSSWAAHNRYLEVAAGIHQQNYREQDRYGLTPDGTLNTETGSQSTIGAALRWQDEGAKINLIITANFLKHPKEVL